MSASTRIAAIAMLLAGCEFLGHGTQPPAAPDAETVEIDAPDLNVDTDGDGVRDPDDVCPAVNDPEQRDHDGDRRGDLCDRCPHRPDDDRDADGDGVGDACDPNPMTAGDRIAYFEGFYTDPGWSAVIGDDTWISDAGALHQHHTDGAWQLVHDTNDLGDVLVEARARVNQLDGDAGARRSIGIVTGYRDNDDYWFCGVAASGNIGEVNAGKVSWDLFDPFRFNASGFDAQLTGEFQILRARIHASTDPTSPGTTIDCRIARDTLNSVASYTTDDTGAGDIGLRTNGADASFDYIFVVAVASQ